MTITWTHSALAALLFGTAALAGCASTAKTHTTHASTAPAATNAAMDMQAMCEMHRKMMAAPAADRGAMQGRMESMQMSPEDMRKHMAEMERRCR